MSSSQRKIHEPAGSKLGLQQTWAMAVGGMIGGGIFSTLGVVIAVSGPWTWLSFLLAGLVALAAGYAYAKLAVHYGEGGGAFTYLRELHLKDFAGSLSWILIIGYVLTNAVYAFTFGQYLAHVFELDQWVARLTAVAAMVFFIRLNLRGVGAAGTVEVVLVWVKLIILLALAGWGLAAWDPPMLSRGVPDSGLGAALFGAGAVFMAYEGFQLLTYDYEDMVKPDRNLPRAIIGAIVVVIAVYILVALGTAMLIGADRVVEHKEVALAVAGREALGTAGLILVTVGAAFSTGSAINSTLFATARLAHKVAEDGELPRYFEHRNRLEIPDRAVIVLGALAAVLAAFGTLTSLVEAASLTFLFTFTVVCAIACYQHIGARAITGLGALAALAASGALVVRLLRHEPLALAALGALAVFAIFGRKLLRMRTGG